MKVYSARVDRDADDIRILAELSGPSSAAQVLDLAGRYLTGIPVPAKVQFLIEELFDSGPVDPWDVARAVEGDQSRSPC